VTSHEDTLQRLQPSEHLKIEASLVSVIREPPVAKLASVPGPGQPQIDASEDVILPLKRPNPDNGPNPD
jgi:hypothetical protein